MIVPKLWVIAQKISSDQDSLAFRHFDVLVLGPVAESIVKQLELYKMSLVSQTINSF